MSKYVGSFLFYLLFHLSFSQPGPSSMYVYMSLPNYFNSDSLINTYKASYIAFYNNEIHSSKSWHSVKKAYQYSPYDKEQIVFEIRGKAATGIIDFDSVVIKIQCGGKVYETSSRIPFMLTNAYIQDFTGQYTPSIIPRNDKTIPTIWEAHKPSSQELKTSIKRFKRKHKKSNYNYILTLWNSDNERITDAFFMINGDTLSNNRSGNYCIDTWSNDKLHIEVIHPNYPTLLLDSCLLGDGRFYLPKSDEFYYMYQGSRVPYQKEQTTKVHLQFNTDTPQNQIDSLTQSICKDFGFVIATSFRDSMRIKNELYYGCNQERLSRSVELRKINGRILGYRYMNQLQAIEQQYHIASITRPLSFHQLLNDELIILFKKEVSENEILNLESHYKLRRVAYPESGYPKPYITYKFNHFPASTELVEQLMCESIVQSCSSGMLSYTLCE